MDKIAHASELISSELLSTESSSSSSSPKLRLPKIFKIFLKLLRKILRKPPAIRFTTELKNGLKTLRNIGKSESTTNITITIATQSAIKAKTTNTIKGEYGES